MSAEPVLALANGAAAPRARVPRLSLDAFQRLIASAPGRARRVSALFGAKAASSGTELVVVLAADGEGMLELASTELDSDAFPSLTPGCPQVHLFEREIAEQWNLRPEGHPWLKPVRFAPPLRLGQGIWQADQEGPSKGPSNPPRWARDGEAGAPPRAHDGHPTVGVTDFYRVEGEEVHEVAVGPVHAGVIEPGHFRFQCHGEEVFHLEISLGYQHRGVERALIGGPNKRTIHYFETLAGDTTIGHATAYCQTVEALTSARPPARALALRAVALELERLANHAGGLGALAGDVGFLPTAAFCGRLRGEFLNLTAALCGSRFGRGLVRPGGVRFDAEPRRIEDMLIRLDAAYRDTAAAVKLLWETASVQARFEETGRVEKDVALQLGLVGVAARACGLRRDVRKTHPTGLYRFVHLPISTWVSGDVFARAYVRWLEIQRSVDFILGQLRHLPRGAVSAPTTAAFRPGHIVASLVEGWRGEICHVAMTDDQGRFARYKVVDPSFHNWTALAMALRDQQVSDFPLCNKSFDLSYCGHDL
jgi:Ni,Fe-hydrogenase III large subunit